MPPPRASENPLVDLVRSLITVERSRAEFVATTERHMKMLNDLHRDRERALDLGLYVAPHTKLMAAFEHVTLVSNVPEALRKHPELDKQIQRFAQSSMRDVVKNPERFRGAYAVLARSKGFSADFFQENVPLSGLEGASCYLRGRFLDCLIVFGVTHSDLSGAIGVQERIVALLGHIVQHPEYRQALIAGTGSAAERLRVLG